MEHYLTTYTKDYLWPYRSGGRGKGPPKQSTQKPVCICEDEGKICHCKDRIETAAFPSSGGGGGGGGGQVGTMMPESGWTRVELMGPLLDPKIYPAKVGASPETPSSHYDQPNAFMDKLQLKYPMLYSVMQKDTDAEVRNRINRDRNKTTYMTDYCEAGPGGQFATLQRAADFSGTGPCSTPMRLPGDPCRSQPKPRAALSSAFTKARGPSNTTSESVRASADLAPSMPPFGRTEYQEGVGRLGAFILKDRLHRKTVS